MKFNLLKAIAIDDEPVALSIIAEYCRRLGDIELSVFSDPVEGLSAVKRERPDLVFLDVEMNGLSGIDVASELPERTNFIFTTAYARFAIDGFELNAVDFLHKPFTFDRFSVAVGKVRELMRMRDAAEREQENSGERREITLKVEYRNVKIPVSEIVYVESMDNYVKIHLPVGDPVVSQISMKEMCAMLPEDGFVRIHRSYIVPVGKVTSYTRRQVSLSSGDVILPVGRVYADGFLEKIRSRNMSDCKSRTL